LGGSEAADQKSRALRLQILDLAKDDLIEGYQFYEAREAGLGDYFLANPGSSLF
jgi:hypothetical protein